MREYTDQEICQIIQDYDRIIQELRYVVEAFVRELASLDSNDDWLCRLLALQHSGTGSATTHSSLHDLSDLLKNKKFKGMLETVVRNRVSVNSANKARKPLARHRRFDAATKDYEDLTKEVLALME